MIRYTVHDYDPALDRRRFIDAVVSQVYERAGARGISTAAAAEVVADERLSVG